MDVLKQKLWGKGLGIFKLKTLVVGWVALLAYEFIITNTTKNFNNISSLGYKIYKYKIKCTRLQNKFQMKMHFYLLWSHLYYYYFITKIAKSGNQIQLGNEIQLKKFENTSRPNMIFFLLYMYKYTYLFIYTSIYALKIQL